jgi:hypothetical protein
MSKNDYEKAQQKIAQLDKHSFFSGPKQFSLVNAAEMRLKVKFPPDYSRFLSDYGAGGIGSFEIYGLNDDNLNAIGIPNLVWYMEKARKEWQLPQSLIPIYDLGDGEVFCLDISVARDETDEVPVIAFDPCYSLHEQNLEIMAKDFGSFFLSLIEQEEKRNKNS